MRVRSWVIGGYLLLLHAALVGMVVKTDFLTRAGKTLGLVPGEEYSLAQDNHIFARLADDAATPPGSVLLLGDSIIAGLGTTLLPPHFHNRALGGETARGLQRWVPALRSLPVARAAVLGIGVNDTKYRQNPQILADYAALLGQLPPHLSLTIVPPLPVDEAGPAARERPYLRNARLGELGRGIGALCAARPGCRMLDPWPLFLKDAGLYSSDGWHLSARGSAALAGLIQQAMGS